MRGEFTEFAVYFVILIIFGSVLLCCFCCWVVSNECCSGVVYICIYIIGFSH